MRTLPTALLVLAFAACTKDAPPAPTPAVELASVAASVPEQPSCGGTCGDEKEPPACGAHADHAPSEVQAAFDHAPAQGEEALCLVMNRKFVVDERTATSVHEGKTYAFCCDGCKQAFDENPAQYVHAGSRTRPTTVVQ